MRFTRDKNRFLAAWVLFGILFAARGIAVCASESVNTEYLGVIIGFDEEGEVLDGLLANGVLVNYEGVTYMVTTDQDWESAYATGFVSAAGESDSLILEFSDSTLGVALFRAAAADLGYSGDDIAAFAQLEEGETVWYGGFVFESISDNETLGECIHLEESSIAALGGLDEYLVGQLEEPVSSMYFGGAVFTESGKLAGILSSRSEGGIFIPAEYFAGGEEVSSEEREDSEGRDGSEERGASEEREDFEEEEASGQESYSTSSASDSVPPILSGRFLVLFFGGLAAFAISTGMYLKGEMQKKDRGLPEFSRSETEEEKEAVIYGVSGFFKGKTFVLSGDALVFGRDRRQCSAVYPVDAKGVSSLHCKIERKGEKILLTDLGSTYGTFLKDGSKLVPHVSRELHSGDSFYLAGPVNTFQVR